MLVFVGVKMLVFTRAKILVFVKWVQQLAFAEQVQQILF